jgi:hypothetical protein
VISVEIDGLTGQPHDIGWTLHVTAKDEADLARIQYAAQTTSDRLKRRYSIRNDP